MNKKDAIRMAREAGIRIAGPMDSIDPKNVYIHELERFADLVAADERQNCYEFIEVLIEAEREACAKLLEDFKSFGDTRDCAAAIRARGQHG